MNTSLQGEMTMQAGTRIAAFIALLLTADPAAAVDFDQLDRHIAKEPVYRSKPVYALVLLGPDANIRVWMALDGDRLYVDKNCNGDLTDDGPAVEFKHKDRNPASFEQFEVSPNGGQTVYNFDVALWNRPAFEPRQSHPESFYQSIHVLFPDGRLFGAWGDHLKPLTFAAALQDAPVLHFGGELRMGFEVRKPLEKVDGGFQLSCCVGTPGSCPGAWAHLLYKTIPENVHPRVVMELPPEKAGGAPVRVECVLGERC
jgi:hypothetical protein